MCACWEQTGTHPANLVPQTLDRARRQTRRWSPSYVAHQRPAIIA